MNGELGRPMLQPSPRLHGEPHIPAKQLNSLTTCAKSARLDTVVENSRPCPALPPHSPPSTWRAASCLVATLENIFPSFNCFPPFLWPESPAAHSPDLYEFCHETVRQSVHKVFLAQVSRAPGSSVDDAIAKYPLRGVEMEQDWKCFSPGAKPFR